MISVVGLYDALPTALHFIVRIINQVYIFSLVQFVLILSLKHQRVLSLNDKVEIINQLNKGVSEEELAERFGVGAATVSDITTKSAKSLSLKLGNALCTPFLQQRSIGQPISGSIFCEKALIFCEKLGGVVDIRAMIAR